MYAPLLLVYFYSNKIVEIVCVFVDIHKGIVLKTAKEVS